LAILLYLLKLNFMSHNFELQLAQNFTENTNRNIFLTGKAGTGKTTFLHHIKEKSLKRLVVVAPTGVAAINARGVTIHSFFQLPFGPTIPGQLFSKNSKTTPGSGVFLKMNKRKIDLIRTIDLLIIDEISMVRADLLDGVDQILRHYKNKDKVFGGTQVLMIGDLQQLAPVVKTDEWELLRPYYSSPYFFDSQAFAICNPVNIELKHIYRQKNEDFIHILNQIRNNKLDQPSLNKLNEQYQPHFAPREEDGYITLTTHNKRAAEMNDRELNKLQTKSKFFSAKIDGDFPPISYPNSEDLELKMGAQVMFIKNDSSPDKRYFNGKIGKITSMTHDAVMVSCPGEPENIEVGQEEWQNIKYSLDKNNEIEEDVSGTFKQIPLRLAWAITIHKSQGLTFDKAIIDAEASFAHGQTYVALSRCKTLEGIVLKNPINRQGIIQDERVASFTMEAEEQAPNAQQLAESKKQYELELLDELFNFKPLDYLIYKCQKIHAQNHDSLVGNLDNPLKTMKEKGTLELIKVSESFRKQLLFLSQNSQDLGSNATIQERIAKAITYYSEQVEKNLKTPLSELTYTTDNKTILKDFKKELEQLEELVSQKLHVFQGLKDGFQTTKYLHVRAQSIFQKIEKKPEPIAKTEESDHPALFKLLKSYRNDKAVEEEIIHFQVFTQKALFDMIEKLPVHLNELKHIHGLGKAKIAKYGADLVEIIRNYCDEHGIEYSAEMAPEIPQEIPQKKEKQPQVGISRKTSLEMFKSGLTIAEIAAQREFSPTTIHGHLVGFVATGEIQAKELMDEKNIAEIETQLLSSKTTKLTELYNLFNGKFSYNELQVVLKKLEYEKANT